jgi:hypothetical protein
MKTKTTDPKLLRRRRLTAIRNQRLRDRKKAGDAIVTIALSADELRRFAQRGLTDPQKGSRQLIRKALTEIDRDGS